MNVRINASSLKDKATAQRLIDEANALAAKADAEEAAISAIVDGKING